MVFTMDPDKSTISFLLKGNVHDTHGSVIKFSLKVFALLDSEGLLIKPEVSLKINAHNLDTKHTGINKRMKKKFLEVEKYPDIIFSSTGFKPGPEAFQPLRLATRGQPLRFDLAGDLTIHGTTNSIVLKVTAFQQDNQLVTEGHTTISLKDFGIKNPSLLFMRVSDQVTIDFHIILMLIK